MSRDDHFRHEEEFHAKDRKYNRKERKIAIAKDRSKFKKTDQDQIKKRHQETTLKEGEKRGRILAISPEGIVVSWEGEFVICSLKGVLKKDKSQFKNLTAVGDFVHFSPVDKIIHHIEERTSILSRADNLSRKKQQLIAVNIDQVLITASVLSPPLKTALIDRYIIAAHKGNMLPVIVINKIDLLRSNDQMAEQEKKSFEEFLEVYSKLGISIYPVSVSTGEGLAELKQEMREKSSVFSGQSGVGKSSLINALLGTELTIGELSAKTFKGSHTTTAALLIPLEGGGFCIDTPGIRSFGLWDLTQEDIQEYFPDISQFAGDCRFPDCAHLQEPDCAVKKALEENQISHLRFASYSALMASLEEEHRNR